MQPAIIRQDGASAESSNMKNVRAIIDTMVRSGRYLESIFSGRCGRRVSRRAGKPIKGWQSSTH